MFDDKCTVLPIWVRDRLFNVTQRFPHRSKKHPESETSIIITHPGGKKTKHIAHVTTLPRPNLGPVMRLQFGNDVKEWLSKAFNKTFQRNEERKANGLNGPTIERLIPFWEFIDIEWDCDTEEFHFRAWYSLDSSDYKSNSSSPALDSDLGKQKNISQDIKSLQDLALKNEVSIWKQKKDKTPAKSTVRKSALKRRLTEAGIDWRNQESSQDHIESIFKAWMVLQSPESIYADVETECYEYPRSIPNGARISEGDYLICTLPKKSSTAGKRIIGVGRINRIIEYNTKGKKMRKAFYDWYRSFPEPKTFEFIGGDPRNNIYNAMNSIPSNRVNGIINLLLGEFSDDDQLMEKEAEFLTNLTSDTPATNQFPDWLTQALNNADN